MQDPLFRFSSWGGAKYLDWWSLVHLLSGVAVGYPLRLAGLGIGTIVIISGVFIVGWEWYEKITKIHEPWPNTFFDIILGFGGLWIAFQIPDIASIYREITLAVVMVAVWATLDTWGWYAWKKRHEKQESAIDAMQ